MISLTPEMIEKAKTAKSAEELLEIAKVNGVEMTADEAKTYFAQLNPKSGELDDDDLDNVAGGAGGCNEPKNKDIFPVGTKMRRKSGPCLRCGQNVWTSTFQYATALSGDSFVPVCDTCGAESRNFLVNGRDMSDVFEVI